MIKAYLIDLDGVLTFADRPAPGALATLTRLRAAGIPYRIVTNTSTRGRAGIAATLSAMGVPTPPQEIICPPYAAGRYLRALGGPPCALFTHAEAQTEFAGLPVVERDAEWLVVGDLADDWTFHRLNQALRLLLGGARLMALGMTRYWHAADGPRLDVGPIVTGLAYAAGVAPLVMGKPDPAIFQLALDDLGTAPGETAMIGDDIRTDVAAAQAVGLHGILVRTGRFKPADLDGQIQPDQILNSIADLTV
jgi:HAD superfamily hydrolase (TIGR01458 family)